MLNCEQGWSKTRAELLMDITACLAQHLQRPEDFRHIPGALAGLLGLPRISLAVVQTLADESRVLLSAHCGGEIPPGFERELLAIHQRTRPLAAGDGTILRPAIEFSEMDLGRPAGFPRAAVFTQGIDERHRMLLLIHTGAGDSGLPANLRDVLPLIAGQLAKGLEGLVVWMARPRTLGEPFNRLTDREWEILRGLGTDAGEKTLADQFGVSQHTLHSHVKSIYRKIGVRGRLPLVHLAEDTLRALRLSRFNARSAREAVEVG